MTNFVTGTKEDIKVIKEMCASHIVRLSEVKLDNRDEYILKIETSFFTWLKLRKVLPLGKPVLIRGIES